MNQETEQVLFNEKEFYKNQIIEMINNIEDIWLLKNYANMIKHTRE